MASWFLSSLDVAFVTFHKTPFVDQVWYFTVWAIIAEKCYPRCIIWHAKITKNLTPLLRFAWLFYNKIVFKKFEHTFFDQVTVDAKRVSTFEKCPLVAELKLKMSQNGRFFMFSISALPPKDAFQMSTHYYHLWTLGQKRYVPIFERRSGYKIIRQNVAGGSVI